MSKRIKILIGVFVIIFATIAIFFTVFYNSPLNDARVGQNINMVGTANENRSDTHPLGKHIIGSVTMLAVNDLEKSVAFYRDKLGFEVRSQFKHIAGLTNGAMNLYLFTKSPPTSEKPTITLENLNKPGSTSVVIDILVDDCRAAYEKLAEVGVKFMTPPKKPLGKEWRCFAMDPDGYLIEIEEGENSPFF